MMQTVLEFLKEYGMMIVLFIIVIIFVLKYEK